MQLLREVDRELLGPLRLRDRPILIEDQRLERSELGIRRGIKVVGAGVPRERAASARGERRHGEEQDESVAIRAIG